MPATHPTEAEAALARIKASLRKTASKGFTYRVVDRLGNVHLRYSAGHTAPRYTHAAIRYPTDGTPPSKACISYASRAALAHASAATMSNYHRGVISIVPVEAIAGRVKTA